MSRKSYRQIGVNSRITVETEREGHMSNTGTRFFGMPLEQLVRSNRVGGVSSSLGHTENWFRLLHRSGAPGCCFSHPLLRPVAAALVAAALRWPEPRLSLIRAAQPETLMGGESSQIIRCQGSKKVWSSDRFAELLAVRRVEDSSE